MDTPPGASLRMPMQFEDFLALDDTKHQEFFDGLLVEHPPNRDHVTVAGRLTLLLQDAVPPGYRVLPAGRWRIEPEQVFQPDIMMIRDAGPDADLLPVPPQLVVEVSSRSTRPDDLGRKREVYAAAGAPWYFVADVDAHEFVTMHNQDGSFAETDRFTAGTHPIREPLRLGLDLDSLFAAPDA
jgi:Uma2 family endonuclease